MTGLEHVQQLLAELGPAVDAVVTVLEEPDGQTWAIELEDETIVSVEYEADLERLAFTVGLPKPAADRRSDVYEALLTSNMLWPGPLAVRAAMDEPGGELVLIGEMAAPTLDLTTLTGHLADFIAQAGAYRDAIAAGCVPAVEPGAQDVGGAAIRV